MQNVVTVPWSGSSTSSVVGTPSVGQAPRGGTYTLWQAGQRWPTNRPSASARRYRLSSGEAVCW